MRKLLFTLAVMASVGSYAQKFNSIFYIGFSVVIIISNVLET